MKAASCAAAVLRLHCDLTQASRGWRAALCVASRAASSTWLACECWDGVVGHGRVQVQSCWHAGGSLTQRAAARGHITASACDPPPFPAAAPCTASASSWGTS